MAELNDHIAKLREDFTVGTLDETDILKEPFEQFTKWLNEAVQARVTEVQAMHLATVSVELKPSSRIVYLRQFADNRFGFYTNYNSKKAVELNKNPHATLTFFWPELERQIRIEGVVEMMSPEASDAYFNARPYESKVGAWASHQSHALKSREELERKIATIKMMFTPDAIIRPDFWGGFELKAEYYEFWQGRKSRLHDRITFTKENNNWIISRIAP